MEITKYLKYGTTFDFNYGDAIPISEIDWETAKTQFKERLIKSAEGFKEIAFCGTMSACCIIHLTGNKTTWSVDIGVDTDDLSKELGCKNYSTSIQNLEECIIKIQELSPYPRSSLEDIYAFTRQKFWSEHSDRVLCEGGTDYLLTVDGNIFYLAVKRKDYSVRKALKIIDHKKISNLEYETFNTYQESFNNFISVFSDEDLIDFGLIPPIIPIKETIEDYMKAVFEWGYQTVYKERTKVFGEHFNLNAFSPYINDKEMVEFCLSLPIEMKFCLGRGKHILKEAIPLPKNIKNKMTNRIFPYIYKTIIKDMNELTKKYLMDKNRIIFSYLPYDKVQKHLQNYVKAWNLLNLSIRLETQNGNR